MSDPNAVPPAASPAQPDSAKSSPAGKPASKKRRRWPWIVLGIFVFLIILIALAPTLLSGGLGRRIVLGQVNKQLNGTAGIKSWSLGWFSGFKINGVSVVDAQGQPVAEVQSISLPATIPSLLSSHKKLGAVAIEGPTAHVVVYADGTTNLSRLVKPSPEKPPTPLGFDLSGDITLHHGEISVQSEGSATPVLMRDLDVVVKIESLEKPITLDLKAALGEERSPLTVNGSATVFHAGKVDPSAIDAKIAVTLDAMEVAPFVALAKQFGVPVSATGRLTVTKLDAQVHGANSVQAIGDISLNQLALSGGALGNDRPKFDRVALKFDVSKTDETVQIAFSLDSLVATAKASGSVKMPASGKLPKGSIVANALVNLPALAAQFPGTLKLQKGLTVDSGSLKLDATLDSDDKGARVDGGLSIENLAGTRDGQRIALDKPIVLKVKAAKTDQGLHVDNLELTSSFATLQGSGSMEKFHLILKNDIEAAMREAGKFVDLANKSGKGKVVVELDISGPAQQKTITGGVTLTGVSLDGFTPGLVKLSEGEVKLSAQALLDDKNALKSITGVVATLATPFANGTLFSADSITFAPGQSVPTIQNGKVDLDVDIDRAAQFADDAGLMPAGVEVGGKLKLEAAVAAENGVLHVTPTVTLKDFIASLGKKHLSEPKVTVTGSIEAMPATRTLKVTDLVCEIAAGKATVKTLEVSDWSKPASGIIAKIAGTMDIARALVSFKDFATLPEGMKVSGQAEFNLTATVGSLAQSVALHAGLKSLKVTPKSGPAIEDEMISVDAAAGIAPMSRTLTLDSLAVKSSFLNLTANGSLADWSGAKNLTLDGTQECDWTKIGPLVAAFSGQAIQMSGKDKNKFHVSLPLGAGDAGALLRRAIASAGVHIDLIKLASVAIEALDLPLNVRDGIATAKLTGKISGGKLNLPAKVDASKETAEFTLPPDTMILSEAKITDEMADQALSKVLPIFKGCVGATGTVSLDSKSLDVPLGEGALQKAAFEGGLAFKGVTMRTTGQLGSIMGAFGMADAAGRQLPAFPNQRVTVSLKNGRVVQGPMLVALGQLATLKISGSVGLADKTLDMVAETPVTAAMVAAFGAPKDVFQYVKDQTLRVKIQGTTDKPEYVVSEGLKAIITTGLERLAKDKLLKGGIKLPF